MLDHLVMLACGWVGGVASTLLIRHALDERRLLEPLDPALLPTPVPAPPRHVALPHSPPHMSPYAPKPKPKPSRQRAALLLQVWAEAKQDTSPSWPTVDAKAPRPTAADLLPSIAWGTPHGGEGTTHTKEVRAQSAAEGHDAQAPRRRVD